MSCFEMSEKFSTLNEKQKELFMLILLILTDILLFLC